MLGGRVHTVSKNAQTLIVANKKTGLEVNVDKTKYMIMSRDQNAARICSLNIDNISFERVEMFRYLGTTVKDLNSIQDEIKCRLELGIA
jgi:hypothetical protein